MTADAVVRAVQTDLEARSALGMKKYGAPLSDPQALETRLQHLHEELLDGANYIKGALMMLRGELP